MEATRRRRAGGSATRLRGVRRPASRGREGGGRFRRPAIGSRFHLPLPLPLPLLLLLLLLPAVSGEVAWGQEASGPAGEPGLPAGTEDAASSELAPSDLQPPPQLAVEDTPDDPGESLSLRWAVSPDEATRPTEVLGYRIERSIVPEGPFEEVSRVPAGTTEYIDNSVLDGTAYHYRLRTIGAGTAGPPTDPFGPVLSRGQWFDRRKTVTLIATALFCFSVVALIHLARRGRSFYIRPIPGLSAVDEAIGRATEMGRPILYLTGLGTSGDVATLAAFTLLGRVARKTAEYQTQVLVPCYDPIVMTIAQEIVKSSCLDAGRPDLYRADDIFFVTQDQFSYTAAVNGIMLRERPATNFYIGKFYAESLVLAETGNLAGSIQIAGTDEITQIPFFVAACDYTLIGEELYASSAYLSQEPPLLGTLKAQDYGKAVAAALLVVGTAAALLNWAGFVNFFRVQ